VTAEAEASQKKQEDRDTVRDLQREGDIFDEKERQDDRKKAQEDEEKYAKRRKKVLPTDPRLQSVAREHAEVEPDALEVLRPQRRKNDRRKTVGDDCPTDSGILSPLDCPKCGGRQSTFAPRPRQIHHGVDDAPSKVAAERPHQRNSHIDPAGRRSTG
jgi:hypothetical protein